MSSIQKQHHDLNDNDTLLCMKVDFQVDSISCYLNEKIENKLDSKGERRVRCVQTSSKLFGNVWDGQVQVIDVMIPSSSISSSKVDGENKDITMTTPGATQEKLTDTSKTSRNADSTKLEEIGSVGATNTEKEMKIHHGPGIHLEYGSSTSCWVSPKHLVIGCDDGCIKLFSLQSDLIFEVGESVESLKQDVNIKYAHETSVVTSLDYSTGRSNNKIISAGYDSKICMWDLHIVDEKSTKPELIFMGHEGIIYDAQWASLDANDKSKSDTIVVSTAQDGFVALWDTRNSNIKPIGSVKIPHHVGLYAFSVDCMEDRKLISLGLSSGHIAVCDLRNLANHSSEGEKMFQHVYKNVHGRSHVGVVKFYRNELGNDFILSGGDDKRVAITSITDGDTHNRNILFDDYVRSLDVLSPNFMICGSWDGSTKISSIF